MPVLGWERWLEAHPWEQGQVLGGWSPGAAAREPLSLRLLLLLSSLSVDTVGDAIN